MIQLWSAVIVAVLTVVVGPLLRGEMSGRLAKRIRGHAELREKLKESGAALTVLDELLTTELNALRRQETHRLTRKLNGSNVAALIIVAGVGGAVVYGLVALAVSATTTVLPLAILLYLVAAAVGLLTIGLAAVGVGTLYEEPKTPEQRAEAKAARVSKRAARPR